VDNISLKTEQSKKPRILIVGGVAGGASCAARARRLSEDVEIIVFERGPFVSFANCGLPYYVGNVITHEQSLLVATPELFNKRFNIEVRVQSEVLAIDREKRELTIKNNTNGEIYTEKYDFMVLAPGSSPIKPPLPGIDLPGIFTLRSIPDSNRMKDWIVKKNVKRAVVVGGGFIGLETAENLVKRGISVTIIEMLSQVMPPIDPEMVVPLQEQLTVNGVNLHLSDGVAKFEQSQNTDTIIVKTKSGANFECDMVLLAIGVKPEVSLAKQSGLEIGALGGIRVTNQMRTSDENIWAVGDAVEVQDFITGEWSLIPLAGPANRQGRIAADVIMGRKSSFRGVQGTMVCKVFSTTIAASGVSEKTFLRLKTNGKEIPYEKVYLHPNQHAAYYPGAKAITMKLIYSPKDGRLLGAQAIGEEGVEKRIDVIAMAIQKQASIYDLEEAELCYAPQFGTAKDPINFAGMVAANALRGDSPAAHWANAKESGKFILDVREPSEFKVGHFEGANNIPLPTLRNAMRELPHDKEILVYCGVGQRSYYAARILRLNGFQARSISGGMMTYKSVKNVS
jgi:NADPH-dependent 2,4-dienoyl-CoA reductase/sulfur reductase-like enzyme/rhodanese-related sulfurtransferase